MKRRDLLLGLSGAALASCARMDQRKNHYDTKECPFCVPEPGVCSYCEGSGECTFCSGTGTRKTTTKSKPEEGINPVTYEEECPFCKGSGKCRYCDGVGKCWACRGTGRIEDWNFYEKHKVEQKKKKEKG